MNRKCVICRKRRGCLNYQLGGLIGDRCSSFVEEPEITEEQQKLLEENEAAKKSIGEKLLVKKQLR